MLHSLLVLLVLLLVICLVVLVERWKPSGPRIIFSQIPRVAFAAPRSAVHALIQLLWVLVTLRFGYFAFVQPFIDAEIWEEYMGFPGGLMTAWLGLFLLYFPWLLVYFWCAFYFDQKAELKGRPQLGN